MTVSTCYYCKKIPKTVNGFLIQIKWTGGNTGYVCVDCLKKELEK